VVSLSGFYHEDREKRRDLQEREFLDPVFPNSLSNQITNSARIKLRIPRLTNLEINRHKKKANAGALAFQNDMCTA
jgi:hypothetical protein